MRVQDQKNGKSGVNLHGTILKGKSIGSAKKKNLNEKAELMIWRTKMQARVQGMGPTHGFNLLQMSPNWS